VGGAWGAVVSLSAILFDLDETLVDFRSGADAALRDVLGRAAAHWGVSRDELMAEHEGILRETELHFAETGEWTYPSRRFLELSRRYGDGRATYVMGLGARYHAVRMEHLRLFEGAGEMLQTLRRSFRLGLITNGPAPNQWEEIRAVGVEGYMDAIVVCGELAHRKPDPRAFTEACARLRTEPSRTLMVGNSLRDDVLPAIALGMPAVWIDRDGVGSPGYAGPTLRVVTEFPAWLSSSGLLSPPTDPGA